MDEQIWGRRPCPGTGAASVVLGIWRPTTPAELSACRRELSAALHDGAPPSAAQEAAVERLLLAFEEIASNALRHARPPVRVEVVSGDGAWLIDVSDADPGSPPAPATDRDPALGGLGLPLVARISAAHGWAVEAGRKHVWAQVDQAPAPAHAEETAEIPPPRPARDPDPDHPTGAGARRRAGE